MTVSYKGPMTTANATCQVQGWDEQPYDDRDGAGKLTAATVQQSITGDIEGSTDVRWLMAYTADDRAEFVGIQVVTGTLGGRRAPSCSAASAPSTAARPSGSSPW